MTIDPVLAAIVVPVTGMFCLTLVALASNDRRMVEELGKTFASWFKRRK